MTTPTVTTPTDTWSTGDAYDAYVGRWSECVAAEFLDWLDAGTGRRWLDLGCGTGALTRTVLERCDPRRIVAVDPSEGFLAHAAARVRDPRVTFSVGTADALPPDARRADAAVAGLVLNFVPSPVEFLATMGRIVGPNGVVAVYVWDYAEGMRMMRHFWDAAVALDPAAAALDEAHRFPSCTPAGIEEAFRRAGLAAVDVRPIEVPLHFDGFDDFWTPFLGGQGPAPSYLASLPGPRRDALREAVRDRLPMDLRGAIELTARAWAARATGIG
jgi:trans-aconitate methyltransferase